MALQYLQDEDGKTIAVVVPIDQWNVIAKKYSELFVGKEGTGEKRKKASDFKGILSPATADALLKHVEQSRNAWDRVSYTL